MSARVAKRCAGWFMFAWLAMWVSAVLLPCSEVAAALAAHEQSAQAVCGQSGNPKGPDPGGSAKHAPCSSVAAPTQTPAARPAATGGNPVAPVAIVSAPSYVLSSLPEPSFPLAHRAAPPPVAVYLRNLRLLI